MAIWKAGSRGQICRVLDSALEGAKLLVSGVGSVECDPGGLVRSRERALSAEILQHNYNEMVCVGGTGRIIRSPV
jgi:hypothetical protein